MIEGGYPGKRCFDLIVAGVVAIPVLIACAACALAVRVTSKGPVLFRQERVGLDGTSFTLLKFRTMVDTPDGNPVFPDDERITPVGRLLRRTSLDELPQLINVARGEMSIVGPRPTLRYQTDRYTARQRRRLGVRPGITGLAQVRGRNKMSWSERIELDIEYVERQSLGFDLRIIIDTVHTVLGGSGVEGHPTDDPLATSEQP